MTRVLYFGLLAIALAVLGVAMWLVPGVTIELETLVIVMIGIVIFFVGYHRYIQAKRADRILTEVEDVEERPPIITPGDPLDSGWDEYRFEAAATATVANHFGCTHDEARELLVSGEWTDDAVAASYFTPGPPIGHSSRLSLLERIRPQRETIRPLHRATIELAEMAGIELDEYA